MQRPAERHSPAFDVGGANKMKLKLMILTAALAALAASATAPARAEGKKVLAHYMPWFVARPFSSSWGWHWTMNHFDPDKTDSATGHQQIASYYYPLIGPYDSADPAVLEYHVLLMKLAGIDGVIVDWYGQDDFYDYAVNNTRTLELFKFTRKAGLSFCLCYEDATVQHEIDGGLFPASGAVAHARQTLLYAQAQFFNDPGYLRWNNAPVLLNFGPQYFRGGADWTALFSPLAPDGRPALFTEDHRVDPAGTGGFDWPPMSASAGPELSRAALNEYLTAFGRKAAAWPAFVSSAFPRFHDIYSVAGAQRSFPWLKDDDGATLRDTLALAMTNGSAFVQLVTWNDFGEGTIIEPTTQYGCRDLAIVQESRRHYLEPGFPFQTNDLALPMRLFQLRRQFGTTNPVLAAEMDRIFTNIVSGNLTAAGLELTGMESGVPIIYNASATNGQLQFSIGGYLSGTGLEVRSSSALAPDAWATVTNLSVSTNLPFLSASLPPDNPGMFVRVQSAVP